MIHPWGGEISPPHFTKKHELRRPFSVCREKWRQLFSFFPLLGLTNPFCCVIIVERNTESRKYAGMAELADARDLKSRET